MKERLGVNGRQMFACVLSFGRVRTYVISAMFVCCCCNLMIFYDWRECVMSVLGTTNHSQYSRVDTWQ